MGAHTHLLGEIYREFRFNSFENSRSQVGELPLQVRSDKQVMLPFPLTPNPSSQANVALLSMKYGSSLTMMPLSGLVGTEHTAGKRYRMNKHTIKMMILRSQTGGCWLQRPSASQMICPDPTISKPTLQANLAVPSTK